jgi:hypothetical protein
MNFSKLVLACSAIAISIAGCTPEKKGVQQYEYTYTNNTTKDIRVDLYKTLVDYNTQSNLYLSSIVPANGGTYVIPSSEFEANAKYYVDWYSSDYTYTNWQNRLGFFDEFNTGFIPTHQKNYNMLESINDYARLVFMNGNGTESHWVAIDGVAYPGGNTTSWAELPESYKYRKLSFYKDFSCKLFKMNDSTGHIMHDKLTFRTPYMGTPEGVSEGMIYLRIEDKHDVQTVGIVTYGISYAGDELSFANTITVDLGDEGRYIMVRDSSLTR